ncbi:MAG: methionyl-tRNA formyltransferase [Dehalococcoidia bacterium]|nr:MAG: methionyl-tRNA formyltransferase [Dehalococcoidia bacterium]
MRVVFMGTPEFSVPALEWLVQSEYEVVAVYTQPDKPGGRGRVAALPPVKRIALEGGLEVLQPATLRDPAEVERLAALKPDVIVVAAFGQILPQSVLDIPGFGCLNIHPSLLPSYRGASPIPAAILAGDEDTGVTIMLMDAGMDTGPILSQFVVEIEPGDTTASLTIKLAQAGTRLLAETLPLWLDRCLTPQPQDESRASYTTPIAKEDGAIDWRLSANEIWRRVRAFYPWPGCYTRWQGRLLRIHEAVPLHKKRNMVPGRVIALASGQPAVVGVETGDGILGLFSVQLEGKRAMPAAEFLRGQRGFVGDILGSGAES